MSFPPPGPHYLSNLSAMAPLMNLAPNQYQVNPMGIMQMPLTMPGLQVPHVTGMPMGITVPTGVSSISAPPRKITHDSSILPVPPLPNMLFSMPGNHLGVPGVPSANHLQQNANRLNAQNNAQANKKPISNGPSITVFVGNITERASDMLIRQLLSKCGSVNNWKRVQGANGKLQGFGFCEYSDPESAIRAIRLLHDFEVAEKRLVVKADAKAREKLDEYIKGKNPGADPLSTDLSQVDAETKREDSELLNYLRLILKEHEVELSRDPDSSKSHRRYDKRTGEPAKPENLADMDMEEEKRSLIHREIDKFRDTYKIDEIDKKSVEEKDKPRDSKSGSDRKEADRDDLPDDRRSRERSIDHDIHRRNRIREKESIAKERSRQRERYERERSDRSDRIDRERMDDRSNMHTDVERMIEDEEEIQEKRRLERRLREKEASYQKRLRNWEARELRKSKDYVKYEMKQEMRKEDEVKEMRGLKQFLEDYDDDRDDPKYYKGNSLARRLRDREKEKEEDARDRRQEKRELDDLRKKLTEEGHPDPELEAQKRLNSSDRERDKIVSAKIRELMSEARSKSKKSEEDVLQPSTSDGPSAGEIHVKAFTFTSSNKVGPKSHSAAASNSPEKSGEKRKKLSVQDVFNTNEDDDSLGSGKRRKLPPLNDDNTDSNQSLLSNTAKSGASTSVGEGSTKNLSSEEKKKQVKLLIERIPIAKDELFSYKLDWEFIDSTLMDKRIRPWVNKKIAEYIGEEDKSLLDFIISRLQAKSSPQAILDEIAMILDEEAETFVVKMWRLLIYEIEAKKLGIGK